MLDISNTLLRDHWAHSIHFLSNINYPFRPLKAQPVSETLHLVTNTGIRLTALVWYKMCISGPYKGDPSTP